MPTINDQSRNNGPGLDFGPDATKVAAELQRVYLEQGTRPPWTAILLFAPLYWSTHEHVSFLYLALWLGSFYCFLIWRWRSCVRAIDQNLRGAALQRRKRFIVTLRTAGGLILGSGVLVFFQDMPMFERLVCMAASIGWYASTVIASIAYPPAATIFGTALFGPTLAAWLVYEQVQGAIVAFTIVIMLLSLRAATDGMHRMLRQAIQSRLNEQALAHQLELDGQDLEAAIRAKSQFLAAASHDLRQPVTSMNLLYTAMQAATDEAALRRVVTKFEAPLKALEEVLTSILEISRLEAGIIEVKPRRCALSEIFEPLISEYRSRASAKRVVLESEVPDVNLVTDPELLRRVVRNLLDNAVKFTEVGVIRVTATIQADGLQVSVRDTGPGIPETQQERVFDDYFQADNWHRDRRQGLGLGLSIVRRLIRLLEGEITLNSRPGKGAEFVVHLPGVIKADENDDDEFPDELFETTPTIPAESVLVVEDDKLVVDSLATVFGTLGIKARYAMTGEDALMQTSLGRFLPDLALVDFGLPGRYDGLTLIRHLKARLPQCRFLLVTGDTNPEVLRRATEEQVPVLHKPITIARLSGKLQELGL